MCTATPHSGIEESFRSLLGLLDAAFDELEEIELPRAKLVPHIVQRRRRDLERWLGAVTPFPSRESIELAYSMGPAYLQLFEDVLGYCRESVTVAGGARQQQRVRYWAAVAILRCVLSSPAAAEAMLEKRADKRRDSSNGDDEGGPESQYPAQILDSAEEDEPPDYIPTAPLDDPAGKLSDAEVRKLDGFLRATRGLAGAQRDKKLATAAQTVNGLLREGYSPIVYCRFIATAKYVAENLQKLLEREHSGLRVVSVTGGDGDSEQRAEMVAELRSEPVRVLVATDCLSEGINLQEHFNAVVHYDLPWNPNRLEQREGRVDRFGQRSRTVKTVLLYGSDNPMDLVVLDVLIRKARTIRRRLGIAVPVPVESEEVVQAVVDSVLLRGRREGRQLRLGLEDPKVSSFHAEWDKAADREGKAHTYFAQHGIKPDEVARELEELEPALGSARDVQWFIANAIQRFNGHLRATKQQGIYELHPGDLAERIMLRAPQVKSFPLRVAFEGIPPEGVTLLGRNHPVMATVTDAALARALSGRDQQFSRCGAIFTSAVSLRTAVLVLRLRYLLEEDGAQQFAEEVVVAAFRPSDRGIEWLEPYQEEGLRLLRESKEAANMSPEERKAHITWALAALSDDWYKPIVAERVRVLEASHARLRSMVKAKPLKVTPHTPPDILGCYVAVPAGGRP